MRHRRRLWGATGYSGDVLQRKRKGGIAVCARGSFWIVVANAKRKGLYPIQLIGKRVLQAGGIDDTQQSGVTMLFIKMEKFGVMR